MLIKDKDILSSKTNEETKNLASKPVASKKSINSENMRHAWGDAFDYYLRGITENYLHFHGRATRLEFWGYMCVAGIISLLLHVLASYIEMPMIVYYYLLATLLPSIAVTVRRFHDVNKKAFWYLIIGVAIVICYFFIGFWIIIPFVLWVAVMIRLLSGKTDLSDGLFGMPNKNDEVYDNDNDLIIKKFLKLAILLCVVFFTYSYVLFDNWKKQNEQNMTIDYIFETAHSLGEENNLTKEQQEEVHALVRNMLKSLSGQVVSEKKIKDQIALFIQQIKFPESVEN